MKVFVAFGYNERDKWIPEMVFPILEAFGIEVVTGGEIPGKKITTTVIDKINNSDALIGFLTRREKSGSLTDQTHKWVTDEVAAAIGAKRKVIEVHENGLDIDSGITDDMQYLKYNEKQRDKFLVELVTAISELVDAKTVRVDLETAINKLASTKTVKIKLLPSDFCVALRPLVIRGVKVDCHYLYKVEGHMTEWYEGNLESEPAGLVVKVDTSDLPQNRENVLIQVKAAHPTTGQSWFSDFEPLGLLTVTMQ
jgi:hypothetical protein